MIYAYMFNKCCYKISLYVASQCVCSLIYSASATAGCRRRWGAGARHGHFWVVAAVLSRAALRAMSIKHRGGGVGNCAGSTMRYDAMQCECCDAKHQRLAAFNLNANELQRANKQQENAGAPNVQEASFACRKARSRAAQHTAKQLRTAARHKWKHTAKLLV